MELNSDGSLGFPELLPPCEDADLSRYQHPVGWTVQPAILPEGWHWPTGDPRLEAGYLVGSTGVGTVAFVFDEDNARLVSAAQELLEAAICQQAVAQYHRVGWDHQCGVILPWIKRMDALCPLENGKPHNPLSNQTRAKFVQPAALLRRNAIAKALLIDNKASEIITEATPCQNQ